MNHEFLPVMANSDAPNGLVIFMGIASCLLFFLLGFFIGWRIWRRCRIEVDQLDVQNRKLARRCKIRETSFIEQQEKIARLLNSN